MTSCPPHSCVFRLLKSWLSQSSFAFPAHLFRVRVTRVCDHRPHTIHITHISLANLSHVFECMCMFYFKVSAHMQCINSLMFRSCNFARTAHQITEFKRSEHVSRLQFLCVCNYVMGLSTYNVIVDNVRLHIEIYINIQAVLRVCKHF